MGAAQLSTLMMPFGDRPSKADAPPGSLRFPAGVCEERSFHRQVMTGVIVQVETAIAWRRARSAVIRREMLAIFPVFLVYLGAKIQYMNIITLRFVYLFHVSSNSIWRHRLMRPARLTCNSSLFNR